MGARCWIWQLLSKGWSRFLQIRVPFALSLPSRAFVRPFLQSHFYVNARGKSENKSASFVDVINHFICLFELKVSCLYCEKGLCPTRILSNGPSVHYINEHLVLIAPLFEFHALFFLRLLIIFFIKPLVLILFYLLLIFIYYLLISQYVLHDYLYLYLYRKFCNVLTHILLRKASYTIIYLKIKINVKRNSAFVI